MKEVVAMVKGYIDDLAHLLMSFVAIGAISEVIFGTGVFGVNVIENLTSIIAKFGEGGFAGLLALLKWNTLMGIAYLSNIKKGSVYFPFFVKRFGCF